MKRLDGVYRHDHREDLLVAHTDEGQLILPPDIEPQPCGMCGHSAYATACPPMTHFEFVKPIPICGRACQLRWEKLLRLPHASSASA